MLILYGTKGCHLCDQAEQLLRQLQAARALDWRYVDIALNDSLIENYGQFIPVLHNTAGRELRWPFSILDVMAFVSIAEENK